MVESQVSIWPRLKCLSGLAPAFSWNDFSCHRNNVLHVSCLNSPRLCFSLTLWMAIFLAKSPHLLKIQHFESDWGRVPRRLQSLGTSNLRFGERHLGLQDSLLMTWMLVDSCFKTSETSLTLLQILGRWYICGMLCLDIHSLKGSYQRVNCCNLIWIHPKKIFRIQKMHSLAFTCFYLVGFKICLCELHAALPLFQPGFWKSEAETKAEGKAEGQDGKSRTYQVGRPSNQRGIKSLEILTSIYIVTWMSCSWYLYMTWLIGG